MTGYLKGIYVRMLWRTCWKVYHLVWWWRCTSGIPSTHEWANGGCIFFWQVRNIPSKASPPTIEASVPDSPQVQRVVDPWEVRDPLRLIVAKNGMLSTQDLIQPQILDEWIQITKSQKSLKIGRSPTHRKLNEECMIAWPADSEELRPSCWFFGTFLVEWKHNEIWRKGSCPLIHTMVICYHVRPQSLPRGHFAKQTHDLSDGAMQEIWPKPSPRGLLCITPPACACGGVSWERLRVSASSKHNWRATQPCRMLKSAPVEGFVACGHWELFSKWHSKWATE